MLSLLKHVPPSLVGVNPSSLKVEGPKTYVTQLEMIDHVEKK